MAMHRLRAFILPALICACVVVPAHATPVTYYFDTGVFSGSLAFDPGTRTVSNVILQETGYPEAWVQVDPSTFVDPTFGSLSGADVALFSPSLQFPSAPGGDVAAFLFTDSTFFAPAPLDGIHTGYADMFSEVAGYYGPVSAFTNPNECIDNPNSVICEVQRNNHFTDCATTPNALCSEDPNTPIEFIVEASEEEVLTLTPPAMAVPEPSSLVLLCGGIFSLGFVRWALRNSLRGRLGAARTDVLPLPM